MGSKATKEEFVRKEVGLMFNHFLKDIFYDYPDQVIYIPQEFFIP